MRKRDARPLRFPHPHRVIFSGGATPIVCCRCLPGLRHRCLHPGHMDRNRERSCKGALATHIRRKPPVELDLLFRRQGARLDTSSP